MTVTTEFGFLFTNKTLSIIIPSAVDKPIITAYAQHWGVLLANNEQIALFRTTHNACVHL